MPLPVSCSMWQWWWKRLYNSFFSAMHFINHLCYAGGIRASSRRFETAGSDRRREGAEPSLIWWLLDGQPWNFCLWSFYSNIKGSMAQEGSTPRVRQSLSRWDSRDRVRGVSTSPPTVYHHEAINIASLHRRFLHGPAVSPDSDTRKRHTCPA